MDKYSFDRIVPRYGHASLKWNDPDPEVLPLWVADMDYSAAPCIMRALQDRLDHGVFGYVDVPDAYYDAIAGWMQRRHGWSIEREWILCTTGVVPALSAVVKALTAPGDEVIILTPVYNCFFTSITNNGCRTREVPLLYDSTTGRYSIDYEALEAAARGDRAKLLLFCNPHNPACRVWTPQEMQRVWEIAARHGVRLVSDEIHCEIVMDGLRYTPMASVCEEMRRSVITCASPSKSFNIAGLHNAFVVCSDAATREAIYGAVVANDAGGLNPFGVAALPAAYSREGEQWLDELNSYIAGNYRLLRDFVEGFLPGVVLTPLEGTYLAWINVRASGLDGEQVAEALLRKAKLRINPGSMYGDNARHFVRVNLATSRQIITEAIDRVKKLIDDE